MTSFASLRSLIVGTVVLASACSSNMMDADLATQLRSVSPRGGAAAIAVSADMVLTFDRPMMAGMEQYLVLHRGAVTGPTIPMGCNWSDSQKALTCRPSQPLASATRYVIHMGGGMLDGDGQGIGMEGSGMGMGGQWATSAMMAGQTGMMGSGWVHANGSYGMVFEFTTQ